MTVNILNAQIVPIDVQKMQTVFCDTVVEMPAEDLAKVTKAHNEQVATQAQKAAADNLLHLATLLTPQFWVDPNTLFPFQVRIFNPECNAYLSSLVTSSWFCLCVDPKSLEILPGKIHPWFECTTVKELKDKVHKCVVEDGKIVFECRCIINGTITTALEVCRGGDWEKKASFEEKRASASFSFSLLWAPEGIEDMNRVTNLIKKCLTMELEDAVTRG